MFVKALLAVAFVWLFAPQEPDLGPARPHLGPSDSSPGYVRREILNAIGRVRTDLKTNIHIEKPI